MERLNCYATFIIFWDINPNKIKGLKVYNNIFFSFREDPSKLNWHSDGSFDLRQIPLTPSELRKKKISHDPLYELLIYAENESIADEVLEILRGTMLLQYPLLDKLPIYDKVFLADISVHLTEFYKINDYSTTLYDACNMVVKAWDDEDVKYSIIKYVFSLDQDSISPHSADPYYGQVFSIERRRKSYQVNAAYAFLSAYSIIEELGLEIRSSSTTHRFINENKEWNPKVKQDICKRLEKLGINEADTFQWVIRGNSEQLVDIVKPKLGKELFDDLTGETRDLSFKIYDAIHIASYIRNFFLAHKFNEIVKYINPYDTYNMQSLSRRLILSKLGFWKHRNK